MFKVGHDLVRQYDINQSFAEEMTEGVLHLIANIQTQENCFYNQIRYKVETRLNDEKTRNMSLKEHQ